MDDRSKLLNLLEEYGLHTITTKPTRITHHSETAIDYIITNIDKQDFLSMCNVEVGITDHLMQCISINNSCKPTEETVQYVMQRTYSVKAKLAFQNDLMQETWNDVYKADDVNDKFNAFHGIYKQLYDKYFPLRKIKERGDSEKEWLTNGIKITSHNYRELCKAHKTSIMI